MTVRIVLADDQQMMRSGLRMILENEQDFEVVAEAGDGAEAVDLARRLLPSVVVMDIRMPRLDGIEATRRLVASPGGAPRVLILTTFDADEYVYAALRAGASGFLLKTAPPDQLVDGVRLVAGGDALLAPSITRRLIEEFVARSPRPPAASSSLASLSGREHEVLQLVAAGLSNQEIAERLFVTTATVKAHVGSVLSKLDLRDRVQAVVFAYESGIVLPGGWAGRPPVS
jgi:DNA-binding NarL/FixJ family response regulator